MKTASIPALDALLVLAALAVPIVVLPDCRDGYVVPKEALFEMLAWTTLLSWAWSHLLDRDWRPALRRMRRRPIALPLAACVVTSALSLALGSVEYVPVRACLLGAASIVFFLILLERLEASPHLGPWIAGAYVAATVVCAAIVIHQDWHPDPATLASMQASLTGAKPDWRFALIGTAGNPNFCASGFIVALPLAVCGSILARRGRILWRLSATLIACALLSTFSAAGMAGAALALVVLTACLLVSRVQLRRLAMIAVVLLMALSFYLLPNPLNARGESYLSAAMKSPLWAHGYQPRLFIWRTSALMIEAHPLFGVGFGGYFPEHQKFQGLHYRLRGTPHELPRVGLVDYAHSVPVQRAAETGLLGLLALAWMVVVVACAFVRACREPADWLRLGAGLALLAAAVQSLPDSPLYTLFGRMGILVSAALLLYRPSPVAAPVVPARLSPVVRVPLLALLIVLGGLGAYRLAYPILAEHAIAALDYASAVRYGPQDFLARHGYANLLAARGQYARAREQLVVAYRLLPDADTAYARERLSLAMGDLPGAIAARRDMLAVNPCYGPWYESLADLLQRAGAAPAAEEARRAARRFALPSP